MHRTEIGKIRIYGDKMEVARTQSLLLTIPNLFALSEGEARLKIQDFLEEHNIKADILYDGNTVWNKKRILANAKRIVEHGTLYNGKKPAYIPIGSMLRFPVVDECILSDYFYSFLNQDCGSIAHYNKQGWVTEYPTLDDLRQFFRKNEFGRRVRDDIPDWRTDTKRLVLELEKILGIED